MFGPGSWFTSVLPHLLVPELATALRGTQAHRLVALNLAPQPGETGGFSPHTHLEVLAGHSPGLAFDVVLADSSARARTRWVADLEKAAGLLAPGRPRGRGRGRRNAQARSSAAGRGVCGHLRWEAQRGGRGLTMAMTGVVKDELSRVTVTKPCCRKAEVSAMLRFAGGLHLAAGQVVVEAELDTGSAARRLRKDIARCTGTRRRCWCWRRAACARATGTSCGC